MKVREQLMTPTGAAKGWVSVILALLALGIGQGLMVAYVGKEVRKICGIIVLIDDRNQRLPPADDDTNRFRRELHDYRRSIGC